MVPYYRVDCDVFLALFLDIPTHVSSTCRINTQGTHHRVMATATYESFLTQTALVSRSSPRPTCHGVNEAQTSTQVYQKKKQCAQSMTLIIFITYLISYRRNWVHIQGVLQTVPLLIYGINRPHHGLH